MKRERLDQVLVSRGLAETRSKAQAIILSGKVLVAGTRVEKPGTPVDPSAAIEVEVPPRFVSRGGEKLQAAIEQFEIPFEGCAVLDVGASTGGFTDCALQNGAAVVTCIDVGRAQLHERLRRDPRVTNIEKLNARLLRPGDLPRTSYDRVVVDVSFISLRSILPAVWPWLAADGWLIALVKPQFEAGRKEAAKARGVIRDDSVRQRVLDGIVAFARAELPRAEVVGTLDSPIKGAEGNREFLLVLRRDRGAPLAG